VIRVFLADDVIRDDTDVTLEACPPQHIPDESESISTYTKSSLDNLQKFPSIVQRVRL